MVSRQKAATIKAYVLEAIAVEKAGLRMEQMSPAPRCQGMVRFTGAAGDRIAR